MIKEDLANIWRERKIADERVIEAFLKVPREHFVLEELKREAYSDQPLPIMCGKTISQPTTIVVMTSALELKKGEKVLEVGTGSGYQAALIGSIVGEHGKVVSAEVVPELVRFSKSNLNKAGIKNVLVIEEDGSRGYEKAAPYDKILVTAACPQVPEPLLAQLKTGGILVAPVGNLQHQEMLKLRKHERGFDKSSLGEFIFLPLVGKHGFSEEELD
ncbi:protein-L-isoaspartate(D-aspartate) O-methyltransferase [Candidatus Woesearchaeota archaeon]|nr:protein-L-isoaspartate(D-aspartate) O-methyltransferase [Candidatus Woesearchaeota archaeon]